MQHRKYSIDFKEQALAKARTRGARTLASIAEELNLSLGTLKGWLKEAARNAALGSGVQPDVALPQDLAPAQWSAAQRLAALLQSHSLQGAELSAWCRQKGLFEHQLQQWKKSFCAPQNNMASATEVQTKLRQEQRKNETLARELLRKDRALAEAAALLVLQKKFQALLQQEAV